MKNLPEHLTRQLDIIPLDVLDQQVTIIGAGAIGSWVALALAKMGISNITVYDDDEISIENMNCQFYPMTSIGQKKVTALAAMVELFTGVEIDARVARYEGGPLQGIVISAVDSMAVRRKIWEEQKNAPFVSYVIDPRMGAETALMYVMNPNNKKDVESYEKTLYTDEGAEQERCTAKATIYTANLLSGLVCKAVKDLLTQSPYPRVTNWSIKDHGLQIWKAQESV
jgi:molybdopterin/thiamine biosynthesis adenylyltransferase